MRLGSKPILTSALPFGGADVTFAMLKAEFVLSICNKAFLINLKSLNKRNSYFSMYFCQQISGVCDKDFLKANLS